MHLRTFFEQLHQQPLPWWLAPLVPLTWFYGAGAAIRPWLYEKHLQKSTRVSVPVISIGNLTTGGTGKTPVVIALAKYLTKQQKKVVVLSRGYGAKSPQSYAQATTPDFGDEAYLIQQAVPEAVVIVGRKRAKNAQRAVSEHQPDVILLDDGYQYLNLHRDVNIALIDGNSGFGNGHLLPLGPLRESLRELKRADAIVLTKQINAQRVTGVTRLLQRFAKPNAFSIPPMYWPFESECFYSPNNPTVPLAIDTLKQEILVMLSAIARPESFLDSLKSLGVEISEKHGFIFPDHHNYVETDLQEIWQEFPDARIITTEKDWVKLAGVVPKDQWGKFVCLRIHPQIEPYQWEQVLQPIADRLQLPSKLFSKAAL